MVAAGWTFYSEDGVHNGMHMYIYIYKILVIPSPTSPGLLGTPGLQAVIAKALPGHASGHAVYHWDAFHFFQSQFQVYIVYGSVLLALSFLQLVYFIYIYVYHIYITYMCVWTQFIIKHAGDDSCAWIHHSSSLTPAGFLSAFKLGWVGIHIHIYIYLENEPSTFDCFALFSLYVYIYRYALVKSGPGSAIAWTCSRTHTKGLWSIYIYMCVYMHMWKKIMLCFKFISPPISTLSTSIYTI